ncbi:MAG: DNA polymerase/3'-5' exonuclease PolX [Actinomycetota bacterium]|nr:DNA polymerase/3'-5' exonuclease PolX [Actinomycetota bacterium]
MVKNAELADIFANIARILKIKDENVFKIRAYERVAATLENLPMEAETLYRLDKLNEIPGVGEAIAQKIGELVETGRLEYYEKLKKSIPEGVFELLNVPDIGPRKAKLFYEELNITSVKELEEAALQHKLQNLPGMGVKAEKNILRGIELYKRREQRTLLGAALPIAEEIVGEFKPLGEVDRISIAGSIRRRRDTIGDIDILIASKNPEKIMNKFIHLSQVKEVLAEGLTKSAILTHQDIQVDLRVVAPDSFGAALLYFTGSQAHNVHLREIAVRMGLKINEYGVFQVKDDKKIAGEEEEEIYRILELPYIMPELREDRGEFEAAQNKTLPNLVEISDIKGDFHIHTIDSDGINTIEEMAVAARQRGYQYIAITDHSQSLHIAGGLDEQRLLEQIKKIEQVNQKIDGITVLKGIEVDIKPDGTLDTPDKVLQKLDIVIAAIHSGLRQERKKLTERLKKAMENPLVDIIAHPTGRIIGYREAYDVDIQEIIQIAARTNTVLEINASLERMDLNDIYTRSAKEQGVLLSIGSDAHQISTLDNMYYGITIARRGWLEKENLLNTLPLDKIKSILKKK